MLHLMIGRARTGKTTAILKRIAASTQRKQLLIVPEQSSHETERALCLYGGNQIALHAEVLSFTRLASRIFAQTGGSAAPTLDAGGRLLLMYAALKSLSGSLSLYARSSRKPAFLAGLLDTVDECKSYRVTPQALIEAGDALGDQQGDKWRELGLIYGSYDALAARVAADPRDRLTRLTEALRQVPMDDTDIWVDGFTDFTPQESMVLKELLLKGCRVTMALTCDGLEKEQHGEGVFSPARKTAALLLRMAEETRSKTQVEDFTARTGSASPALLYLEQALFTTHPEEYGAPVPELTLFTAPTPRAEVERAAADILRLTRDEGYRFREIAVAARSFSAYSDLVEEIFPRYGIPVFLSAVSDILQKPILTLITSALETVSNGYEYDNVFQYLKTGLTGLSPDDVDVLENYVLTWNLRGSRWTAQSGWTMHPGGYGMSFTDHDRALLERLNTLRRQVTKPLEQLRKHPDQTARGQAMALYRFLEDIGLPQRLEERTAALRERGELTLAEEYTQLWDILLGGLEQCARLLGEEPMALDEFSQLFRLVLSQYDVSSIPVSLDRVTAGEAPRLSAKKVRALFLLGADDSSIPQAAVAPGLFSDDDRDTLAEFGIELAPRLGDRLIREMTVVYVTCNIPDCRLSVSWSGGDGARPSFLVSRLRRLFPSLPITQVTGRELPEAPLPALERAGRDQRLWPYLSRLPELEQPLSLMRGATQMTRQALSPAAVGTLYGASVPMSASRLDQFQSCHFAYFLRYGLRAKPRRPAGFQAPEYGTFVHYVLEHVLRQRRDEGLPDPSAAVRETVNRYIEEELGGLSDQTPRFRYLFDRLIRSVNTIVENVLEELEQSEFQPIQFELGFGRSGDLPPVEVSADGLTVSISGFVDRVDGWVHDGRLYLRVVDYKTGRKSFDFTDLWNGMGLQMLLYLFTLEREGSRYFGQEIVPAGVLYLPARDAILSGSRGMDESARKKLMDAELKRKGILLSEEEVLAAMGEPRFLPVQVSGGKLTGDYLVSAERLGKLGRRVDAILEETVRELAAGNISADPFWRGPEHNACQWCDFFAACHFEEGRGGDCRRWQSAVKAKEFWGLLEQTPPSTGEGV
ncbi:MAG: ATP-dependent nuclease subunit [Oscillospiraceae bacterium]|nr:ATP-dependent nuclease subunit [Oscillospiraceae bacterium]